jgi:hypothetical protein
MPPPPPNSEKTILLPNSVTTTYRPSLAPRRRLHRRVAPPAPPPLPPPCRSWVDPLANLFDSINHFRPNVDRNEAQTKYLVRPTISFTMAQTKYLVLPGNAPSTRFPITFLTQSGLLHRDPLAPAPVLKKSAGPKNSWPSDPAGFRKVKKKISKNH